MPSNRIRPSVGSARRLIIRSSVDFPAPDRPMTPTKPPGAIENEALSTAALVPNRHVKPSTTSMYCSSKPDAALADGYLALSLARGFYSYVTVVQRRGCRPHAHDRHPVVMLSSSSPPMTGGDWINLHLWKPAWPAKNSPSNRRSTLPRS